MIDTKTTQTHENMISSLKKQPVPASCISSDLANASKFIVSQMNIVQHQRTNSISTIDAIH